MMEWVVVTGEVGEPIGLPRLLQLFMADAQQRRAASTPPSEEESKSVASPTVAAMRYRLRLDTCGHYPEHTAAIREWRQRLPA
jgi:hypothetical protein